MKKLFIVAVAVALGVLGVSVFNRKEWYVLNNVYKQKVSWYIL